MQYPSAYNTSNTISLVREFIALTKPRVNLLIMFTAIVGMLLAHQSSLNYELIFFASIGIGLAASAAIQLSDFPFECAISEARVARVEGELVINPSRTQLETADIDMMIGASADSVMMVEGEMDECSEEEMVEAIKFAHDAIKVQIEAQIKLATEVGKKEVREYDEEEENLELEQKIHKAAYDQCYEIAKRGTGKAERSFAFSEVKEDIKASFSEDELCLLYTSPSPRD